MIDIGFILCFTVPRLTNYSDSADSCASSGSVFHADTVAATMFSLGLADVEAEMVSAAVEADLLVGFQFLIILCPGDGRDWFARVASRQSAAVSHLHHHLVPEVQVESGWF